MWKRYLNGLNFFYVSFIVLTAILVYYTFKTYKLGANRKFELLCKLTVPDICVEKYYFYYFLEIYNAGNIAAKDINMYVHGKKITHIDFVKPGSAELYPLGIMGCMINGNHSMPSSNAIFEKGETIDIQLFVESITLNFSLTTDIVFETRPTENYLEGIESALINIAKKIENCK